MQSTALGKTHADQSAPRGGFRVGQQVNVISRGRAKISAQVLPGIWGVDFIDLKGFGYVFESELSA